MSVVYRLRMDAAYYRAVLARFDRNRRLVARLSVRFALLGLLAGAAYWMRSGQSGQSAWIGSALAGLLVGVGGSVIMKLLFMRRFRKRADFGTEVRVTLAPSGIAAAGAHTQGSWAWSAFPHAVRFRDGMLLYRGGIIRWLPDAAIESGTLQEALELVAAKSKLRAPRWP